MLHKLQFLVCHVMPELLCMLVGAHELLDLILQHRDIELSGL